MRVVILDEKKTKILENIKFQLKEKNVETVFITYKDTINFQPEIHGIIFTDLNLLCILPKLRNINSKLPIFILTKKENQDYIDLSSIKHTHFLCENFVEDVVHKIFTTITNYTEDLWPIFSKYKYSYSSPGHQGGEGFTKSPIGKSFYDFLGKNIFSIDWHLPQDFPSKDISKTFNSDLSFFGVVGTSGANRSIMQYCIKEHDLVAIDRNCHKSIEQGLILTGARPIYMIATRNEYNIIGPICIKTMTETSKKNPKYTVITNSTYDGLCYNVSKIKHILGKTYLHFDEAWIAHAKFNKLYDNYNSLNSCRNNQITFTSQSTHKMLSSFSQASLIHVKNSISSEVDFNRFNQAYLLHTTTSPFYPITASNEIAVSMMEEKGESLTMEMLTEAIRFRKTLMKIYKNYKVKEEWFFKPWNFEKYGSQNFEVIPDEDLISKQEYWILNKNDLWHGFNEVDSDWVMLDPVKVLVITGNNKGEGYPAKLVNQFLYENGIVTEYHSYYHILFLFSAGVIKDSWLTVINLMTSFKTYVDLNTSIEQVFPQLFSKYPNYYNVGLKDLILKMSTHIITISKYLNEAFETLPAVRYKPREAYEKLDNFEYVNILDLAHRTILTSIVLYPPGIPLMISGEQFGDTNNPQIKLLGSIQEWDYNFPGFHIKTLGIIKDKDGYKVMCEK